MRHDESRPKAARISAGSFASVIRAYQSGPTYAALAKSTQRLYNDVLRIAEREEALGSLSVSVIRPALVQAFLDGLSETPGRQKIARTALAAVQKFALVRDLLPYPIMTGTYTAPMDGGHEPWSLEQVRIAEQHARTDLARTVTLAVHTGQRGSDIVRMRWSDMEEQDGRQGINVVQQKTGRRLWVPFTVELSNAIVTWERRPPFFLILKPQGTPSAAERSWPCAPRAAGDCGRASSPSGRDSSRDRFHVWDDRADRCAVLTVGGPTRHGNGRSLSARQNGSRTRERTNEANGFSAQGISLCFCHI
jgi:integrase